jgi:molybdenum cofactor cytidylyltransferase
VFCEQFRRICLPYDNQHDFVRDNPLIAAIVLAAGKSERMGYPKALLQFRGRTFLEHVLDAIAHSDIGYTVVVVGHHREIIEKSVSVPAITFNPNYEQGMSTSVQAGLRALPSGVSGFALFLVDHPLIDSATIDRLTGRLLKEHIVLPVFQGKRGHPVIFAADVFSEILNLSPDQGLNTVVRRTPGRIIEVLVNSPGVLADIDTPEEFAKLVAESQG